MVPVIRDVQGMNYAAIEKTINDLGEKVCDFEMVKCSCGYTHMHML